MLTFTETQVLAWITPLRDGLNLVAKEFVAANSKVNGRGVLVLSEFAGAATELHGAILTNPFDIRQMCHDLHRAHRSARIMVSMPPKSGSLSR